MGYKNVCIKWKACDIICGVACTVFTVQLMTVWHEYAAVKAYKHTETSRQVAKAQQQLSRGIYLLSINFHHGI